MKRRLVLAGAVSFAVVFAAAFFLRRPDLRRALVERVRYGTASEDGLVLVLEAGVAAPGSLTVVVTNVGDDPRALLFPEGDRVGVEVDVTLTDASGAAIAPSPPVFDAATPDAKPRRAELAPGESARASLDLARFFHLAPGRYRVRIDRARLNQSEPRLHSNELSLELREPIGGTP